MGLVDSSGVRVASYTYDPFGKVLTATGTMAEINPLRYRGYYYDTETGFYYLQSRYYDPAIGRFISADSYASTGQGFLGYNMFAYCGNNPVFREDDEGEFWIAALAMVAVGAVATAVTKHDVDQFKRTDDQRVEYISNGTKRGGKIKNSKNIITPWVQYGYSVYLNYFSEHRKDISGSASAMVLEWSIHNIAYFGGYTVKKAGNTIGLDTGGVEKWMEKGKDVDFENTIFDDDHGIFSGIMQGIYSILNPIGSIADIAIKLFS